MILNCDAKRFYAQQNLMSYAPKTVAKIYILSTSIKSANDP